MSTTSVPRQRFFIYAPDRTEEGTFERRLKLRPTHLDSVKSYFDAGFIRVGGPLLTPESVLTAGSDTKMVGSTFIVEAKNIEEVKTFVREDPFYKSEVWDKDKIIILPFMAATPMP